MTSHRRLLAVVLLLCLSAAALAGGDPVAIPAELTGTGSVEIDGLTSGRRELDGVTWSLAPGRASDSIGAVGRVQQVAVGAVG